MQNNINIQSSELIFGLDIGTRNVVGLVGYFEGNIFRITASEIKQHDSRAMLDGQIHDIIQVAKTIEYVKKALEYKIGVQLKNVAIAAAGRVLKTECVETYISFEEEKVINKNHIQALELNGIEKAQNILMEKKQDENEYFCVGYSVVKYYLNDFMIENLEAHRAKKIGAKILATFLPQMVIDSLYSAVEKAGLYVMNLSLEPIAAINVAIPNNYRLLNLSLVDIGAGTSDIAITKDGSVFAYGMIPIAGDEITEQIVHRYLVDFNTAEQIKLSICKEKEIIFKDIIGITHKISSEEIKQHIEPVVEKLAIEISKKIKELNGDIAPNAVFCVGGGGQVSGFIEKLSKKLELPKERVVLRGTKDIQNIEFETLPLTDPSAVTPIGICITSKIEQGNNFIEVTLNKEKIKLLNTKKLTVMDAAIKKGFNHKSLMVRKGKDLIFKLNNQNYKKRGEVGQPAQIYINGLNASLNSRIVANDKITIIPAENGKDAKMYIKDLIKDIDFKKINVNGTDIECFLNCEVNGENKPNDTKIKSNDNISIKEIETIEDLLEYMNLNINQKIIYVNGSKVKTDYVIVNGDIIEFRSVKEQIVANKNVSEKIQHSINNIDNINSINVIVNDKPILLTGKHKYIFVDIFDFIDFDLKKPKGHIILELNGISAAYTDKLKDNDKLKIYWK